MPLIAYSESPLRNSVRVMVTSAMSMPSWLAEAGDDLPELLRSAARAGVRAAAVGTPAASMTSLAKDLLPSIRAAAADGPNTAKPASRSSSATPATKGASGPMTTRSAS